MTKAANFTIVQIHKCSKEIRYIKTNLNKEFYVIRFLLHQFISAFEYNMCMDYLKANLPDIAARLIYIQRTVKLFLTYEERKEINRLIMFGISKKPDKMIEFIRSLNNPTESDKSIYFLRNNSDMLKKLIPSFAAAANMKTRPYA